MKTEKLLILTVDDVKEQMIEFFTSVLVNDPANTRDLIREGKIYDLPNFARMNSAEVATTFASLDHMIDSLWREYPDVGGILIVANETPYVYIPRLVESHGH